MGKNLFDLSINFDTKDLEKGLNDIQRREVPKAINSAINKTATTVRKDVIRELANETGIQAKVLRQGINILRSTVSTLTASIRARGKAFNLIRFKAHQTKKGVSAAPWKKRRIFKGTFIGNQGRTVFKRTSKKRLPIEPVFGPSIPREFVKEKFQKIMQSTGIKRFNELFPKELDFRIKKKGFK